MDDLAWQTEYSVETIASPDFAWAYMTDVAHWEDPPATFELEGPFTAGSQGTTRMPGQEPRYWRIREVHARQSYVLETELDQATLSFEWRFERLADGGTRLTQHIVLQGENAGAYVTQVQPVFTATLAAGMNKIAATINQAYTARRPEEGERR